MFCEDMDKYVEPEGAECRACEYDDCNHHKTAIRKAAKIARMRDSTLVAEVRKRLSGLLGLDEKEIEQYVGSLVGSIEQLIRQQVQDCVTTMAGAAIHEQLDKMAAEYVGAQFQEAIHKDIMNVAAKPEEMQTTIQKVVMAKIISFLSDYYDRDKKQKIENCLQTVIDKTTESQVAEALQELKAETIEKWDKTILKTMMKGMAKEIGSDKRLMAVINNQE